MRWVPINSQSSSRSSRLLSSSSSSSLSSLALIIYWGPLYFVISSVSKRDYYVQGVPISSGWVPVIFGVEIGFVEVLQKNSEILNFLLPDFREMTLLCNYLYVMIYQVNWRNLYRKRHFLKIRQHKIEIFLIFVSNIRTRKFLGFDCSFAYFSELLNITSYPFKTCLDTLYVLLLFFLRFPM